MKDYFQFTRRQKIGVVSLLSIIVVLVVLLNVNDHRGLPDPTDIETSQLSFYDPSVDAGVAEDLSNSNEEYSPDLSSSNGAYVLFDFDPNSLDKVGWQKLGFSDKQTNAILKYRDSFGPFNKAEDVGKIYVISDEKFEEIKPYMIFESQEDAENIFPIEVNSATAEDLQLIKGIGPAFSERTIKYRELLGGYSYSDQYLDIYGMNDDAFSALKEFTWIDQSAIDKLNVNSASKDEMRNHPYLKDWAVTTEIIVQRDRGKITNLNFLVEKDLMSQEELNRLIPYISF